MPRLLTLTCIAVLAAVLVAGCGSGGGSTTVIERTVTDTSTPPEESDSAGSTSSGGGDVEERASGSKADTGGSTTSPPEGGGKTSDSGGKSPSVESKAGTPSAAAHLSTFQSPSGNIGCGLLGGIARCDIRKRSWSPPPRPPGCPSEVDFGQGLQVSHNDRSGSFVCAGDTALNPSAAKLAYGRKDSFGGFLCLSSTLGVACRNSAGHGFFISIQSYRTF